MQHKVSIVRIAGGRDGNRMLIKKLVRNFVEHGYLSTTMTKAKMLKSRIDSLAHDALGFNEAVKNNLLPYFGTTSAVNAFVEIAKQRTKDGATSGVVRIFKLGARPGDAAPVGKVVWTNDIVSSSPSKKEAQPKTK